MSTQAKSSSLEDSGLDYNESSHNSTQSKSRSSLSPAIITGANNYGPKILSRNSSPLPGVPPTTPTTSGRGRPKGSTNSAKAAKNRQHKTSGASGQNLNHPSIVVTPSLSSVSQLTVPTTLPKSPSASGHQVRMHTAFHTIQLLIVAPYLDVLFQSIPDEVLHV